MTLEKMPFNDLVIFEGKFFTVGQDWEYPIQGFFILGAKRKVRSVSDFTQDESMEFVSLLQKTRDGMKEKLDIHDVYLFQNEDTEHGFHLWIFPRHAWMEKFGRKIQSVRPIMNEAKEKRMTEKEIEKIKESVEKMRNYFKLKNK